jgi:class 3 adenylate cyclase
MSKYLVRTRQWDRNLVPSSYERDDPGFRALVRNLSAKGMRAVGIMGILAPSVYVVAYLLTGRTLSCFDYHDGSLVMWDKALIMTLSLTCIVPRLRRATVGYGRLTVAALVLGAGLASYTDDLVRGTIDFSSAWWALMFLVAVAAMPYKPWHTLLFGTVITAVVLLAPHVMPVFVPGMEVQIPGGQQRAFLLVLTVVCMGISALIYSSRYYLYLKRKRIEELERLTKRRFSIYLPHDVVSEILKRPDRLALGGEKRRVSMLMSDLRGFSVVSETRPPERVVELLNIYLGRMAELIASHGGTIDEFIGDAIFVIFGAPLRQEDHALRAVACAIDMQCRMPEVNAELEARGMAPIEMGIGINTGEVVVGSIGSARRAKYGAVGSHVNLTARIESYTVGGQILATDTTLEDAGDSVMIGREMQLSTKGFTRPISIFEVEAVGAPYNLSLPVLEDELHNLTSPWPFDYTVLDGKHVSGPSGRGSITRLSTRGAIVQLSQRVESLSNLKMRLLGLSNQNEAVGDLYCKVVDDEPVGDVKVRFTAVPTEVADLVGRTCGRTSALPS